jgi:Protein of unknown function (DUF3060)
MYISRSVIKPAVVLAALYCGTTAASPTVAHVAGNLELEGSGNKITATLDCVGGNAAIRGSANVLNITGKCSSLKLNGSGNKITIEFGPAAKVDIYGSSNAIVWTSTDGKPPTINYVGSANTVTPQVQ